jgi:hypothetical protein
VSAEILLKAGESNGIGPPTSTAYVMHSITKDAIFKLNIVSVV